MLPIRVAAASAVLAAGVAATLGGFALGGSLQARLEAGPSAAEVTALQRIDRQAVVAPAPTGGADRGPNRADLGGGRAGLGTAR